VTNGRLELSQTDLSVFSFRNIEGQFAFPPGKFQIDLSCSSNLWERFSLKGSFDPRDFKGEGSLGIDSFLPHVLSRYLSPDFLLPVGESKINMNVRLTVDRPGALHAELEASSSHLTLRRGKGHQAINGLTIKGTFSLDGEKTGVDLTKLSLDAPRLDLAGKFVMDRKSSRVSAELEGQDVDLTPLREAALSIAGDIPIIQQICAIVKGGKAPRVLFQTQGNSMADLGKTENIFIKSGLREGKISIPGMSLDLEEVGGEAVIAKGVLKGEELEARLGNSRGLKGTLALGLEGEDALFNLDMPVEADLAEVAPLLKRLVKDRPFQQELSRISNLKGSALGRLILGKSLSSMKVHAEASEFRVSARYGPIPYNLEITKGQFVYDDKGTVRVQNLGGKLGASSFSDLTAQLSLGKVPSIEVSSGRFLVHLDEIYPWMTSFQGVGNHLKEIESINGVIEVSQVRLQGSLLKLEDWSFEAAGNFKNVAVKADLFKDPIQVISGKFNVTPAKLSFTNVQGRLLDASLIASGSLTQFLGGPLKVDVTLGGQIGAEATRWISTAAKIPADLAVRPPFSLSQGHLTWEGSAKTSLQGKLTFDNGPDVSIDLFLTPQELAIRDLSIQDKVSRASVALTLAKNVISLKFVGTLDGKTLDRILLVNVLPGEWVKGNFEAQIRLDQPALSRADGELEGGNIRLPLNQAGPLEIEHVSLEAAKNNVRVNSAVFKWLNQPFTANGVVNVSPKAIEFDIDLSTKALEFDTVSQALFSKNEPRDMPALSPRNTPPVKGILRLKTDRFTYGNLTWMPLHADISSGQDGVQINVTHALLCGISTPAHLDVSNQGIRMDARLVSKHDQLGQAIFCLTDKRVEMTGSLDLEGKFRAEGKSEALVRSLQGNINFKASDGQILHDPALERILALLNITEVFRGKFPGFEQKGFLYNTITVIGEVQEGKLFLKEFVIDGRTMEIVARGEADLIDQTLNLKVIVAPLKTVDAIVKFIPFVRNVLEGTLVVVPVSVTGPFRDPKVEVLSASAVESELLGIMKRTLQLPLRIIDPFRVEQK
jgi:hypothetical protein